MTQTTLTRIQECLARLPNDPVAREELLAHATDRLRRLTQRMLQRDFARVGRWEDTDDVFQAAMLRLLQALQSVTPATPRDFLQLAAAQIRRQLIDLARHYFGPRGIGARHASVNQSADTPNPVAEAPHDTYNPSRLAEWTEFHQAIAKMPISDRETIELLWYQGLTQVEVAELLGVDVRTIKRRWARARVTLHGLLRDDLDADSTPEN